MPDKVSWKNQNPKKGVSVKDALFHFINRKEALELLGFEESGAARSPVFVDIGQSSNLQNDLTKDVRRARELKRMLEGKLVSMLCSGKLVAKGLASNAPLDARRHPIRKEYWQHLELDFANSSATGTGVFVSDILIFDPSNKLAALAADYPKCSEEEVESWYRKRVDRLVETNARSSRGKDYEEADERFGKTVPRAWLKHFRKEHYPRGLQRGGRPKKTST